MSHREDIRFPSLKSLSSSPRLGSSRTHRAIFFGVVVGLFGATTELYAQDSAISSAYGESVSVNLLPLLGGGINVGSGPLPAAAGSASPAYDQTRTAASVSVSLPVGGRLLQTGILTATASSDVPGGLSTLGEAEVLGVALTVLQTLPLVRLDADVIAARAAIGGTCGNLTTEASTTLAGARVGGSLVPSVAIGAHPAPNTTLLNVAGIRIVLNEQFQSGDGQTSKSVTVNAVHVYLNNVLLVGLGLLSGDVVISQAKASLSCVPMVAANADLGLTMTDSPDPIEVGSTMNYRLTIRNRGPQPATGVVLSNLLPSSVDFYSAEPGQGSCTGTSSLVCNLGDIAAGQAVVVDIMGSPSEPGTIVDTATVTARENDPAPGDNTVTASTIVDDIDTDPPTSLADLDVVGIPPPEPILLDHDFPCDLVVHNPGPDPALETTLVLTFPATTTVVRATSPHGPCQIGSGALTCNLGTVAVGGQVRIDIEMHPNRIGNQTFHATVASIVSDPNPANNETLMTANVIAETPPEEITAASCRVGVVPAATLLVPYFEVDLADPSGPTTLIGITNVRAASKLTRVTVWTDWGVPTLSFDVYLTGYDLQTLNLRDLLQGRLPETGASISPRGDQSNPDGNFPGCGTLGTAPDAATVAEVQAWHRGLASPRNGRCGGSSRPGNNLAVGYVTIDVVNRCSNLTPASPGYFGDGGSGVASNDNALLGDFFLVDAKGNFAQGEPAVHLVADSQIGGEKTFYSRYVGANGSDNRQPLGSLFGFRYLSGGAFTGGTELVVWRDSQNPADDSVACGSFPSWYPLAQNGVLGFDEQENPSFLLPDDHRFPVLTTKAKVGGPGLLMPSSFGWMSLDLAVPRVPAPLVHSQAWVMVLMSAEGRFGVGYRAAQLDDACGF